MDEPTCSVEGCDRPTANLGWCRAHYERQRKTGDLNASVQVRERAYRRPAGVQCAIEGCERPRKNREWCGMHYARWRAHGDPYFEREKPATCSADGCEATPRSRGLCEMHYTRQQRHGDLETHRPSPKPNSEVNYYVLHERLRKARGSASGYQCVRCGKPATTWAQLHGEDPCDFDSYVPMCRSCHSRYDIYPERAEQRSQAQKARWTPERRAALSRRNKERGIRPGPRKPD